MNVTINKLNEVDLNKLAKFTYDVRQSSTFRSNERSIGTVETALRKIADDKNQIVINASTGGEIVGTLGVFTGFPDIAFINSWHPIVKHIDKKDVIAQSLIQECKEYIEEAGLERLEVTLSPITELLGETRDEYRSWYENSGFHQASKEAFMRVDLESFSLSSSTPSLPDGLKFEEIENVKNKELEGPFLKSFRQGKDRLFLDLTAPQQVTTFSYWLDRKRPFHRGSILVMKDDKIVGFSIVRPKPEGVEIGVVGVVPEYWRKGIMKAALHETINRLREDKVRFAQLEADVDNTAAMNLYKMYGFEQVHTQEYYAWSVK